MECAISSEVEKEVMDGSRVWIGTKPPHMYYDVFE
jgi:hypothetical protein